MVLAALGGSFLMNPMGGWPDGEACESNLHVSNLAPSTTGSELGAPPVDATVVDAVVGAPQLPREDCPDCPHWLMSQPARPHSWSSSLGCYHPLRCRLHHGGTELEQSWWPLHAGVAA
jgi:hypothetical protein